MGKNVSMNIKAVRNWRIYTIYKRGMGEWGGVCENITYVAISFRYFPGWTLHLHAFIFILFYIFMTWIINECVVLLYTRREYIGKKKKRKNWNDHLLPLLFAFLYYAKSFGNLNIECKRIDFFVKTKILVLFLGRHVTKKISFTRTAFLWHDFSPNFN